MFYKISLMTPKATVIPADLRPEIDMIRSGKSNSAEALERLAVKARNDFLNSKSLKKANEVLASLREIKASKEASVFRKNFLIFCGVYATSEVSDKGVITYIPLENSGIEYDKKEKAFYEKTPFDWKTIKAETPLSLAGIKTPPAVRKQAEEIPTAELIEYLRSRPDLPEILTALMPHEKADDKQKADTKPKAKAKVDKLIDAI